METTELKERYLRAKRALFDKAFGARLNPEQCKAVFCTRGPLLVLAGAGSGKTTVLVNRISYLIKFGNAYHDDSCPEWMSEEGIKALESAIELSPQEIEDILPQFIADPVPPWSVLAITFTNKAAGEIRERLAKSFDDPEISESIWAGTFHSVCMRILRKYGERVGLRSGFSIYDTDDKKRMVCDCMKALNIDEKSLAPKVVCDIISREKDNLRGPDEVEISRDPRLSQVIEIYRFYEKKMCEHNAVDFDDIIKKTVELLRSNSDVLAYYQRKFRYVLVDEYQDTNPAQFVLTKLLSGGAFEGGVALIGDDDGQIFPYGDPSVDNGNIMVVGDDDQSIYKFRGATVENILSFDRTYPDATVIKLEQNYRSTTNILDAANNVISRNNHRHQKRLWSAKGKGERIIFHLAENADDEGRYILDKISRAAKTEKRKYSDFAVLYRLNALGRSLQTVFQKSGVPYRVIGDMRFYDRKEIKDMVAYLTVATSPDDNLRLKRIINEPKRKIGNASVEAIEKIAEHEGLSMFTVMERAEEYTPLLKLAQKLRGFTDMINKIKTEKKLPSEMLSALFAESGYHQMLLDEGFEGKGAIENVEELISGAVEYEGRCAQEEIEPTPFGFLEEIALVTDIDKYDEDADAVVLMTMHAAKGLEFPCVFIAGMEEGVFPSQQNFGEPSELSEERRLCYVAITRAKERLFITAAKQRTMYGKTTVNRPSRFMNEIPRDLIEIERERIVPPRTSDYTYRRAADDTPRPRQEFTELNRKVNLGASAQAEKRGAEKYGIKKLELGTRVEHATFGEGVILTSKDIGGDVLYEVVFDNPAIGKKKLMATYAKLRKI